MQFKDYIENPSFALSEGSIFEKLRRNPTVEFDPFVYHATLIYHNDFRAILEQVHRDYLDIGQRHQLPMFALTDTWRANQERIQQSKFRNQDINQDNVSFIRQIHDSYGPDASPIFVGGTMGPKGDAYTPEEALSPDDAAQFHQPQIEALAAAGVDFLFVATLPALSEAIGMARAMAATNLPYILSFVLRKNGTLLDGTPLAEAMDRIDNATAQPPIGYAVNCIHPSIFKDSLSALEQHEASLPQRIVSFQANTSARDPRELDGLEELETEEPDVLADLMISAHEQFHTPFMGGCCGTDTNHIESLARTYKASLKH
jgi:homocysteine S-methyltransferase